MALTTTSTSRTDAVRRAILEELEHRRLQLEAAGDVVRLTFTIRLTAGTTQVRGVLYEEERVFSQRRP